MLHERKTIDDTILMYRVARCGRVGEALQSVLSEVTKLVMFAFRGVQSDIREGFILSLTGTIF